MKVRKLLFSDAGLLTVGTALAAVVFIIDSMVPLGVAGGVPYVAIVLAGMWIAWRPAILILAGLATLLTIAGFYTSAAGGEDWQVLANRTLTVAMIWMVALLVHYRRRREDLMVDRERALGTAIVQSVGAMVIILDPTGDITRCNRTCEEITGRTQTQLIGMNILDLIDRTDAAATLGPAFDTETAAQGPCRCETFVRSRENGRRRISWSSTPHLGTAGAVDYLILAGIDITEQFKAREAVRESEELHRNVVENQIDLIARSLPDGTLTFVNDVYCSFFERSREQIIGRNFTFLVHEDDRGAVEKRLEERTRAPTTNTLEIRMRDGSGESRWVQWTAKPITDENGMIVEYQSVGRDVTERRRMEDALRESEELFSRMFHVSPGLFAVSRLEDGAHYDVNKTWMETMGYSHEEAMAHTAVELGIWADAKQRERFVERLEKEGSVRDFEAKFRAKDGRELDVLVAGEYMEFHGENRSLVVSHDVTDLKRAETALRKSEELHRRLLDVSPDAIFVQCEGDIVFANPAAVKLLGAETADDIVGRRSLDFVHPDDHEKIIRSREVTLQHRQSLRIDSVRQLTRDKIEIECESSNAQFIWEDKPAILVILRDMTALREAEKALREAKDAAEQANAAKSRFLAAASHDLRQPLYAMSLFLATLMERFNEPAYANLLEKMEQSLESANKLLGTVLDISKLEAGVVLPELSDFPVQSVLDQTWIEFAPVAEAAGNSLTVMPCSAFVRSDRALMESILRNLVSNAVRHTRGGRILVGCRRRAGAIRIVVRDTGPGIPPEMHEKIFDEFERLDNSPDVGNNGLGLGLAIVDRTAKLLGYEIELESDVGEGAVFAFEVPLGKEIFQTQITSDPPPPTVSSNLRNAIIALIEDDPSILLAIPEYLSRWGCICVTADSADGAITNLGHAGQVPDLVLADYHLCNGETGLDAIRILRSKWGQDMPAVIVTADTSPKTACLTKDAGIPLLTKPVRPAKLRAMLQHLLQVDSDQPPISASGN